MEQNRFFFNDWGRMFGLGKGLCGEKIKFDFVTVLNKQIICQLRYTATETNLFFRSLKSSLECKMGI